MSKFCKYCNAEHPFTKDFWYALNTAPQCKEFYKAYRTKNAGKVREARRKYTQDWRKRNPGYMAKAAAKYYAANRKKVIQANFNYTERRRKKDAGFNLSIVLRQRLYVALKKRYKAGSAVRDLGCSIEEFVKYIESKFLPGMTWQNHGRDGWHIDHIQPLSSFNLENPEEFKQAVHYTNLQPLWAEENIRKSNNVG